MTAHDRHREFFEELTGVVRASFFTGDEVYDARALGYAVAVRTDHQVTLPTGRELVCAKAKGLVPARAWQRMRTGTAALVACAFRSLDSITASGALGL